MSKDNGTFSSWAAVKALGWVAAAFVVAWLGWGWYGVWWLQGFLHEVIQSYWMWFVLPLGGCAALGVLAWALNLDRRYPDLFDKVK